MCHEISAQTAHLNCLNEIYIKISEIFSAYVFSYYVFISRAGKLLESKILRAFAILRRVGSTYTYTYTRKRDRRDYRKSRYVRVEFVARGVGNTLARIATLSRGRGIKKRRNPAGGINTIC